MTDAVPTLNDHPEFVWMLPCSLDNCSNAEVLDFSIRLTRITVRTRSKNTITRLNIRIIRAIGLSKTLFSFSITNESGSAHAVPSPLYAFTVNV